MRTCTLPTLGAEQNFYAFLCPEHLIFTRESSMLRASLPLSGLPSVRPSVRHTRELYLKLGTQN